ncbi:GRF1-interacting factor 1-like protein [Drosera capensis]
MQQQQQQHLMQMQQQQQQQHPMMAAYYSNNVTTYHIQQYLDENKSLILKIVESQNSGKLSECAENQARLQRNLMYLAAIADSQPQPPLMHSQFPPSGIMQPGAAHYMQQHQQVLAMSPQAMMAARSSMLYNQQPYAALQQTQGLHGQLGIGSGSSSSTGITMLQGEPNMSMAGSSALFSDFGRSNAGEGMLGIGSRGLNKQDMVSAGSADGRSHTSDGSDSLYLKSPDDGN